ncbi:Single-stranded DNA-binding protein [subsurface metagenome]
MSGLNKVLLIGNLGRDPEMRFTPDGKAVTDFSLAVSDGKADTVWYRIVCWQGLAEVVNKSLVKGRQVYVEGRLHPKQWEGKDGKLHTSLDVMADKVVFLGSKPIAESGKLEIVAAPEAPEVEPELEDAPVPDDIQF